MSPSVEAVLFDIDDTLCEYRRSGSELLAVAFERVGVDPFFTQREYHERYNTFADHAESVRDLRSNCFASIASEKGYDPETGRALAAVFAAERDHADVDFLPGAEAALDAAVDRYRVGVVTNGDPWMQSQKLEGLGVADRFETVVHAGYDAPAKPAPDPFHAALDDLDVGPERAVHVGNSSVSDVPGAKRAGLRAAWLRQDGVDPDPRPDYVLDSMADLIDPPWE
ncbi:MAG: HAD family hydrolase [Haloarculaceae archaeon]